MTSCTSCCCFSRLHFARNSKMESAGVSSIKTGASDNAFVLSKNSSNSFYEKFPLLMSSAGISASPEINRFTNWMEDISKEKMATGF